MSEEPAVDELSELRELSAKAAEQRLSPVEEDSAAAKLSALLQGSAENQAGALEMLGTLPWIVVVKAISAAWPSVDAATQQSIVEALGREGTDPTGRLRFSVARALIPLARETAASLAASVAAQSWDEAAGAFPTPVRQAFFHVLIGKGKPWAVQLPMETLPPEQSQKLARLALAASFPAKCSPRSQLSILEWLAQASAFESFDEAALADTARVIRRWSTSLRKAAAQLPHLPEVLLAATQGRSGTNGKEASPENEKETSEEPAESQAEEPAERESDPEESAEAEAETPVKRPEAKPEKTRDRRKKKETEPAAKEAPSKDRDKGRFDPIRALKQVEEYVSLITRENQQLKARKLEDARKNRRRREDEPNEADSESIEDLKRRNQQLEQAAEVLRDQLEQLKNDHEDLAASMGAGTETPVEDSRAQLVAFLGMRLSEDYAVFEALKNEPETEVLRQHYRGVLENVFELLKSQGIKFSPPEDASH
jgi:uncharacterized protein (DUF2384 family)